MSYDEQQINNSLKNLEQQQELNNYRYAMARSNQMLHFRQKEAEISQWDNPKQHQSQGKKKSKLPYLKSIKQTQKRYPYFFDLINEPQESNFFKYEKLPPYRIQKSTQKKVTAKKIDIQLPFPHLQQDVIESHPNYQSEASLPLIKKIALPVKLLRKEQKPKLKREETFKLQDLSDFLGMGNREDSVSKRSKVLATTRRQIKSFQSFTERNPRSSFDNNKLKQCITFIK